MGQTIGDILPLAIGVAISPVPIIAVILMLFSERAGANSLTFLLGWVVGIAGGLAVVIAIAGMTDPSTGDEPSTLTSWIKLIAGVLLLLLAAKEWRSRPRPGEDASMPRWMTKIDEMKPGGALGLGLLLSVVNPKNLLLIVGAGVIVAQAELSATDDVIAIVVFTVLGAWTVALPTLAYLSAGRRVQPRLDSTKTWLSAHNTAVMAVLLLVIGVSLFGKGIGGLL